MTMSDIYIKTSSPEKKIPIGHSKMFGDPHVWEGFVWPTHKEEGEEYDLAFLAQINCADMCTLDTGGILPRYGMLYFFYDLDGMPEEGGGCVLYYDGYLCDLHEMVLTDENGEDMAFPELCIEFSRSGDGCSHTALEDIGEGRTLLLKISSFETEDIRIKFPENTSLKFQIENNKLDKGDLSRVTVCLG